MNLSDFRQNISSPRRCKFKIFIFILEYCNQIDIWIMVKTVYFPLCAHAACCKVYSKSCLLHCTSLCERFLFPLREEEEASIIMHYKQVVLKWLSTKNVLEKFIRFKIFPNRILFTIEVISILFIRALWFWCQTKPNCNPGSCPFCVIMHI